MVGVWVGKGRVVSVAPQECLLRLRTGHCAQESCDTKVQRSVGECDAGFRAD